MRVSSPSPSQRRKPLTKHTQPDPAHPLDPHKREKRLKACTKKRECVGIKYRPPNHERLRSSLRMRPSPRRDASAREGGVMRYPDEYIDDFRRNAGELENEVIDEYRAGRMTRKELLQRGS